MASTTMANRVGGRYSAFVLMAVLAASMLIVGADAGRFNHNHYHRHSPPAPPGYDEPMAAPSPYSFRGEPAASPAYSPDGPLAYLPSSFSEGPGPEGYPSFWSDSPADSPAANEVPEAAPYPPESGLF